MIEQERNRHKDTVSRVHLQDSTSDSNQGRGNINFGILELVMEKVSIYSYSKGSNYEGWETQHTGVMI